MVCDYRCTQKNTESGLSRLLRAALALEWQNAKAAASWRKKYRALSSLISLCWM